MAARPRFTPNRRFASEIARGPEMRRYLAGVADSAAANVADRVPTVEGEAITVSSGAELGADGWEGHVTVRSAMWHLPEYGGGRFPPRPYLRPGVQAALTRVRGRWRSL